MFDTLESPGETELLCNSSKQITNLASISGIEKHNSAVALLKQIHVTLTEQKDADMINKISKIMEVHFSCQTQKQYDTLVKLIESSVGQIIKFEELSRKPNGSIKNRQKHSSLKKYFNESLNRLCQQLTPESELNSLLFLNQDLCLIAKRSPKFVKRTDVLQDIPLEYDEDKIIFKLCGSGGRVGIEDSTHLLQCLLAYVESTTYKDLSIVTENKNVLHNRLPSSIAHTMKKQKPNKLFNQSNICAIVINDLPNKRTRFVLNIKFPWHDKKKTSYIPSDHSRIKHWLCDGNPPKTDFVNSFTTFEIGKYSKYVAFHNAITTKIKHLINDGYSDNTFNYMQLYCCRVEPPCNCCNIVRKPGILNSTDNIGYSYRKTYAKKHNCVSCHMELCKGGCGRIYHGETACELTFDEATEAAISTLTRPCPQCQSNLEKNGGCNHMTCRCGCQFCWICMREFERNENGQYMITEHFRENDIGDGLGATCNQFN